MGLFSPDVEKLSKENNIPELLKCLDNKRAGVRYGAFAALACRKDAGPEILAKLRSLVNDPDPWVKTMAVLKFAERGDRSIAENLMEIVKKGSREARLALLSIIAQHTADDDITIMEVVIAELADKNEFVKNQALAAAGATRNRRLMPYVADILHEKHHELRMAAAKTLYAIGGNESADYLIGLLADDNREVVAAARSILESMDLERAKKALHDAHFVALAKGMNGTEPVRRQTVQKIGSEAIREGLALLLRACRDQYLGVRVEALRSLAVFKDPVSIEEVARLIHDKFHDVRIEAVRTLGLFREARAREALEDALNDQDHHVREEAQKALASMQ